MAEAVGSPVAVGSDDKLESTLSTFQTHGADLPMDSKPYPRVLMHLVPTSIDVTDLRDVAEKLIASGFDRITIRRVRSGMAAQIDLRRLPLGHALLRQSAMSLQVRAYNLKRAIKIRGAGPLIAAMRS